MKILLLITLYCVSLTASAQKRFSADLSSSIGRIGLTGLPEGPTVQGSWHGRLALGLNYALKNGSLLSTGLGFEMNDIFVDGRFVTTPQGVQFQQTPSSRVQNGLVMSMVTLPVFYRHKLEGNDKRELFLGGGPVLSYLTSNRQYAKLNNVVVEETFNRLNRLQWRLATEVEMRQVRRKGLGALLGLGFSYQLTPFTAQSSLRGFQGYLKVGLTLR